jgi:hypothetical protein
LLDGEVLGGEGDGVALLVEGVAEVDAGGVFEGGGLELVMEPGGGGEDIGIGTDVGRGSEVIPEGVGGVFVAEVEELGECSLCRGRVAEEGEEF